MEFPFSTTTTTYTTILHLPTYHLPVHHSPPTTIPPPHIPPHLFYHHIFTTLPTCLPTYLPYLQEPCLHTSFLPPTPTTHHYHLPICLSLLLHRQGTRTGTWRRTGGEQGKERREEGQAGDRQEEDQSIIIFLLTWPQCSGSSLLPLCTLSLLLFSLSLWDLHALDVTCCTVHRFTRCVSHTHAPNSLHTYYFLYRYHTTCCWWRLPACHRLCAVPFVTPAMHTVLLPYFCLCFPVPAVVRLLRAIGYLCLLPATTGFRTPFSACLRYSTYAAAAVGFAPRLLPFWLNTVSGFFAPAYRAARTHALRFVRPFHSAAAAFCCNCTPARTTCCTNHLPACHCSTYRLCHYYLPPTTARFPRHARTPPGFCCTCLLPVGFNLPAACCCTLPAAHARTRRFTTPFSRFLSHCLYYLRGFFYAYWTIVP